MRIVVSGLEMHLQPRFRRSRRSECCFFFFQAEDGIRDLTVTGVQTCALPIYLRREGFSSAVCVPLFSMRRAVGSLSLTSLAPDAYRRRHLLALERLAAPLAKIGRASCRERV